jgi:PAS domain S-box-containing protein
MKTLFTPAIALMNRLGYTRKFMLLALISIVAFATVTYSLYVSLDKEIGVLKRELEGLVLVGQVSKAVRLMQQHRGLSAGALSGIETMRGKRAVKEKEVADAFHEMEEKLPASLVAGDDWRNIKADWQHLREKGLDLTQEECFTLHTRLIGHTLLLGVATADEYALTLDPEIDSYYLIDTVVNKLPQAIEYLAQLRAHGIANLADRRVTEPEKIAIGAAIGKLGDALGAFEVNVGKATRYNPAQQNTLMEAAGSIAGSAHQIAALVESDILSGRFATSPEDFYMIASVAIDTGYSQMHESLLSATGNLLKARVAKAENTLRISIGIAILLLLAVTYFAIGIYHSIIDNVRSLSRSARAFADGDMSGRVHLGTRDELGQIGDSFNEMAESFSAMLAARGQAEGDMQKSETKFRTLYESSGDAIMLLDEEKGFFDCNEATLRLFGCHTRDEFINKHPSQLSPPTQPSGQDSKSLANEHIATAFKNGSDRFEWMHCRIDGAEFPAEVLLTGMELNGRQVIQATVRDVTERKQMEDAQARFALIMEETSDLVAMADLAGRITYMNRAGRKLLELDETADISKTEIADYHPKWAAEIVLHEGLPSAAARGTWSGETALLSRSGREFSVLQVIMAHKRQGDGVEYYSTVIHDISKRKDAENKLFKYVEELRTINQQLHDTQNLLLQSDKMASVGQLAAGVAHEINNPIGYVGSNLGSLDGYLKDLFEVVAAYEEVENTVADSAALARVKAVKNKVDLDFLKEDALSLMRESQEGIIRVKKIVQDLKDFSRVDSGDEWHRADLHKGLDSTLNVASNEIKYKAEVKKEYGDIAEVECVISQLNQVFMNLLVNAAHAIEERGIITLRTGQQGDEVWVEVADTGKGIAPEHINKIFDPFFTTKPVGKGTGLGLSLSYGIIQKHHGRIEVNSEVGKGTSFKVWLPVNQPQDGDTTVGRVSSA